MEELDFIYRYVKTEAVKQFMAGLYQLDVFIAAAKTVHQLKFTYPQLIAADKPELTLQGFFHPFIDNAVGNDIAFGHQQNLCFVTGANMAGKSTVLKSIGICAYLAHIGLPVPATNMRTTVFNGLFTTINLSDNIMAGHSHFYREVLRIKEVAHKTGSVKNILVIFDELFRGTNVKDAHDASLAIIKAFAGVRNSIFIVSTHIVEVADELQGADNIFFRCLITGIKDQKAIYNYKLQPGISHEKLGMRIIEDEGLVAMIQAQAER
jgi:DNA mismatch repair ATPase MutS